MKNIIKAVSAGALSLTLLQALPVYAMHQMDDEKQCIIQKIEGLKESLALTADQEKQLKEIKSKYQDFMKKMHKEKKAIHTEIQALGDAEKLDQAKLEALAQRAAQLASDKLKNRVTARYEVNQILTSTQKDKLKQDKETLTQGTNAKTIAQ